MNANVIDDYFGNKITQYYDIHDPFLNPPPDNRVVVDSRGLGVTFMEKMKENQDKVAQIDPETGFSMTHGDILLRSIRVAIELQNRGIQKNDIVSLCTYNQMDSCLPMFACLYLGVRIASLDPTLSQADMMYLLNLVTPKFIFCCSESVNFLEASLQETNIAAEIIVFGNTDEHTPFRDFLNPVANEETFEAIPVEDIYDTAVIFFSSGTTGFPKGICCSHYGLLAQNIIFGLDTDFNLCLYSTSLYWISGLVFLIVTTYFGNTRIVYKTFDHTNFAKYIQQYKVTSAFLAPVYTYKLTKNPEYCNYDTSSLKLLLIGGGPISVEQLMNIRQLFPHAKVCNGYGMTEAAGVVTLFNQITDVDLIQRKPLSTGRPIPGLSYKVVDPDTGNILGPNERGEIRVKGKALMTGYHKKQDEWKKVWDSDGFLITGDVGYYDEDYCFYVVDRIKDLLKYQSWHVPPAEIEQVIQAHPDVQSAVVIGIPDEIDGDLPMGVVVLKPDVDVTEEELVQFVNERVSNRKQLRAGVKFVTHIPLTPSGKLRRRDIRDWVLNGLV